MRKPSFPTRCSALPVAAQVRATDPVFGGISGSTSTTRSGVSRGLARSFFPRGMARVLARGHSPLDPIGFVAEPSVSRR